MRNSLERALPFALIGAAGLAFGVTAAAQTQEKPAQHQHDSAMGTPSSGKLTAVLVEPEKKAAEKAATVKVTVEGVKIIDPATVGEKAQKGQGHLHFQVDDGPVIATTTMKLSFHDLKPGNHTIKVVLANNDHTPAGPQQTLDVKVP